VNLNLILPSLVAVLAGLGTGLMQARIRSSSAVRVSKTGPRVDPRSHYDVASQ